MLTYIVLCIIYVLSRISMGNPLFYLLYLWMFLCSISLYLFVTLFYLLYLWLLLCFISYISGCSSVLSRKSLVVLLFYLVNLWLFFCSISYISGISSVLSRISLVVSLFYLVYLWLFLWSISYISGCSSVLSRISLDVGFVILYALLDTEGYPPGYTSFIIKIQLTDSQLLTSTRSQIRTRIAWGGVRKHVAPPPWKIQVAHSLSFDIPCFW